MKERIVFLDYLRVLSCFMVMAIHSCEPFYLGGEEGTYIATRGDAVWVTLTEVLCRVCVPLFVMASSFLLFPLRTSTGVFFRRRLGRIVVPFVLWSCAYVWWFKGDWGQLFFNFPAVGGHLWFVPMLLGLYFLMPMLSPWAERVEERELRGWIGLWVLTTLFPYLRRLWTGLFGEPLFGYGAVPYLYGECPWNSFGMFHYVSGFVGFMLLGLWFRRFAPVMSLKKTLSVALPLWTVGAAIIGCGFFFRLSGKFPYSASYAKAVDLEMSIEYCSLGVLLATAASFLVIRRISYDGWLYRHVVRPFSEASYGTYLLHMFVLLPVFEQFRPLMPTPVAILATAAVSFALSSFISIAVRKIPKIGSWICG